MAKVFFSYSHKDEALRDQLETHLAMLKNQGLIESWHDRRIVAGSEIDQSITIAVEESDVILLLVSADFIASPYCYSREMTRAMERHDAGAATVIPVILRDCDWHAAPFGKLLAVPKDGKPVTLWPDIDQAFTEVAKQVRRAVDSRTAPVVHDHVVVSQRNTIYSQMSVASPTQLPRSSNLRLIKEFSDQDKDEFLRNGFDFIARFFEGSLHAVEERNPGVKGALDRIDSRRFTAILYKNGKAVSECSICLDGMGRRSDGIAFSYDAAARQGSYNEMLHVEANNQALFFKSMGMQMGRGADRDAQLTPEGAAEFLWNLLISRLQ